MILKSRLTQIVGPFLEIGSRFHFTSTPLKFYTLQSPFFISFSFSFSIAVFTPSFPLPSFFPFLIFSNCLPSFFPFLFFSVAFYLSFFSIDFLLSILFLSGYNVKRSDVTLIDSYLEDIPQGAKERVESNALPIDFPSDLIAPKLFICHSKYQTSVKIIMLLYFNRHRSIHPSIIFIAMIAMLVNILEWWQTNQESCNK